MGQFAMETESGYGPGAIRADRTSVVQHQAGIHLACKLSLHRMRMLQRENDGSRYPIYSLAAESCMLEGELAFAEDVHHPRDVCNDRLPGDITTEVFTGFNGCSPKDAIRFVGVVQKPVMSEGDPEVTLAVGGTDTIINTGTDTIFAGDMVMWDWPRKTAAASGVYPAFTRENVPATKFLPDVRPLRMADLFARWQTFVHEITHNRGTDAVLKHFAWFQAKEHQSRDPVHRAFLIIGGAESTPAIPVPMGATVELPLETEKARDFTLATSSALAPSSYTALVSKSTTPLELARLLNACFADWVELHMSRVIGRALSSARPDGTFDILIGCRA